MYSQGGGTRSPREGLLYRNVHGEDLLIYTTEFRVNSVERVVAALVSARNFLFKGGRAGDALAALSEISGDVEAIEVIPARVLIEYSIDAVVASISNGNIRGAAILLNAVHNIPLDVVALEDWDFDYFVTVEVSELLDNYSFLDNAEVVVVALFKGAVDIRGFFVSGAGSC